jgi:hypothetical protein
MKISAAFGSVFDVIEQATTSRRNLTARFIEFISLDKIFILTKIVYARIDKLQ